MKSISFATASALLVVGACTSNEAPEVRQLLGPYYVQVDSLHGFEAIADDPEDDSLSYRFAWGDGDTSDWTDWLAHTASALELHSWSEPGTSEIRVQARDYRGASSDWSPPETVVAVYRLPGTIRWQAGSGTDVHGAPALGPDGTVYFGSTEGKAWALKPDGTEKWSIPTGDNLFAALTVTPNGDVLFGSTDGILRAFSADGNELWRFTADGAIRTSVALGADGSIYFGTLAGTVYALTAEGERAWDYPTGDAIYSAPAVGTDGTVYIGSRDFHLYAIKPDGTLDWQYNTGNWVDESPAIGPDGTIYVGSAGSANSALHAVRPDGTVRWQYPLEDLTGSSTVVDAAGNVYFSMRDRAVYSLTPEGNLRWRWRPEKQSLYSTPVLGADGSVYVTGGVDEDDPRVSLVALSPSGKVRWTSYIGGTRTRSPTLGPDSIIYVGGEKGLHAIWAGVTPADAPWPMYQHDAQHTGRAR